MQNFVDYYAVLQVHYSAEQDVIEAAYKRLCKKYHPDINPSPQAHELLQSMNEAYRILRDPASRSSYHQIWAQHTGGPQQPPPPQAEPQPSSPAYSPIQAEIVLEQYFEALKDGRLREAYKLLFREVQRKSPVSAFIAWRQSVQQVYQIQRFSILAGEYEENYRIADHISCPAQHFRITVEEKDVRTGKIGSDTIDQVVVQDGPMWRVHLKYKDLYQAAEQFQRAMGITLRPVPDGLVDRDDFYTRAEEEAERFRRDSQPLVLGQLLIQGRGRKNLPPGVLEELPALVGEIIGKNLRSTDLLSELGEGRFALLMGQTRLSDANAAVERLGERLGELTRTRYKQRITLRSQLTEYKQGPPSHVIAELGRLLEA